MSLLNDSTRHANEIFNVINHQLSSRETGESVVQSWARCVNEYQLDPGQFRQPPVLTQQEVTQRRDAMTDVITCAKLEMTTLYQQLADPELTVALVDADGVIVHQVSSVPFAQDIDSEGFRVGAVWSEREAGTNGMGTCLIERDCIAVRQHEHFYPRYTTLTCSAAPIFDDHGAIAGVLDVTSRSKLLQQHSLVLVGMSRQMIENRLLDSRYQHAHMIHFHSRPEFVCTLHGGKLAVDDAGIVLAANRSAVFQLGFRSLAEIRGKHIGAAFNASLEDMLARSIRGSFHPVTIYSANATNRFFLVAQSPQRAAQNASRFLVSEQASSAAHSAASAINGTLAAGSAASAAGAVGTAKPAPGAKTMSPQAYAHAGRLQKITHLEFGDPRMASQIQLAARVVDRKIPILLQGETGSGKEVFANALHSISPNYSGPFVAVNCASLPENLIESELFGYRAGAFTGAQREGRRGKIVQANGGTLFLDEIGDMPLALQARLLRVIDEREVAPLGSETVVKVDFQLISASHRNLTELVRTGAFREDLYYRLNGIDLHLPPLRERADKLALIQHLLEKETEYPPALSPEAQHVLLNYAWPGNIRQLRHVLQMSLALCDNAQITLAHLPAELRRSSEPCEFGRGGPPPGTMRHEPFDAEVQALNAIQSNERETVLSLLDTHRWNVSHVAKVLNISRNTLYRKMHRLHIALSHDAVQRQ